MFFAPPHNEGPDDLEKMASAWPRRLQAIDPIPEDITTESDGRTVPIIDMMVTQAWRRRGLARTMHAHMLAGRSEERVTLLVIPDNKPARTAYERWGYHQVGRIKPFDDSPIFDAMVLNR